MCERWRPIAGLDGYYEISDRGRVKRVKRGNRTFVGSILTPAITEAGYQRVDPCINNKPRSFFVHRLVADAFIGPCPEGKQVNHKDGDKTNNYVENLEYVTPSENTFHAYRIKLASNQGENNASSKLTEEDVHKIRRLLTEESIKAIAERFNVCYWTIYAIKRGYTWGWLKEEEEADNVEQ